MSYYSDGNGRTVYTMDKKAIFEIACKQLKEVENTLIFSVDEKECDELTISFIALSKFIESSIKDMYV